MTFDPDSKPRKKPEKRGSDRRGIQLPCVLRHQEEQWQGFILDLSPSGAFIEVEAELAADSKVEIGFSAQGDDFRLTGEVRHSGWFLLGFYNAKGVGVEFDTQTAEVNRRLRQLLQNSARPAGPKFTLER